MIHPKMKKKVYLVKNRHQKDINIKNYLNKNLKKKQKIIMRKTMKIIKKKK